MPQRGSFEADTDGGLWSRGEGFFFFGFVWKYKCYTYLRYISFVLSMHYSTLVLYRFGQVNFLLFLYFMFRMSNFWFTKRRLKFQLIAKNDFGSFVGFKMSTAKMMRGLCSIYLRSNWRGKITCIANFSLKIN